MRAAHAEAETANANSIIAGAGGHVFGPSARDPGGKGDSAAVNKKLEELTADGELSAADVDALFDAAGETVNKSEMLAIRDGVSGTTYTVSVSGMTQDGTVIASVTAGKAHDAAGNANLASTSTDNTVTFDFDEGDVTPPLVTINQAGAQDPTTTFVA